MNKLKRFSFQALLWLLIGVIIWISQRANLYVLKKNLLILLFQIILIGSFIYFAAPQLLVKKKYLQLFICSIVVLPIFAWILSVISPILIGSPFSGNPSNFPPDFPLPPRLRIKKPPSLFILHFLMLSIAYAFVILTEVFINLKEKEKETINAKNINLQNEIKLLKSQINPHFLFNALNNIYALSVIDSSKTQQSITYLSDMLRYVLYDCEKELVPIKKEITYIKNYLKLFALKNSKVYPITTNFKIENENISIAPMLLIPFIENALKHSNIEKINNVFVNINIEAKDNVVNFEIENSLPKNNTIKDEVGGIGLKNVKKRLSILYPNKHELYITKSESTFKVQLNITSQ